MSRCDLLPVDALRGGALARDVVLEEAGAEVGDGRRGAAVLVGADRICAAVDLALQALGFLARGRRAPVGIAPMVNRRGR